MKFYQIYMCVLLFTGCSSNLSPNLKFTDRLPETWNAPLPKEESFAGKWWEVFNDTLFNQFFNEFRDKNPDLLSISQQIESSNLLAKINGATLSPNVSASSGGGRRLQNLSAFG